MALLLMLSPGARAAVSTVVKTWYSASAYSSYYQAMEGEQRPLAQPLRIDLASGDGIATCSQLGGWRGHVTFLNTPAGTLEYEGTGQNCLTFGIGRISYPDGSQYFGAVATHFDDQDEQTFAPGRVRVAVREGRGAMQDRSGRLTQLGQFNDDALARDESGVRGMTQVLQDARASLGAGVAPGWTAEVRTFLYAEPYELRARGEAVVARDPRRIPRAILQAWPDLAALEPALARYATVSLGDAPPLKKGMFGKYQCDASAGGDARWTGALGEVYLGQHVGCLSSGIGRIHGAHGLDWIGQVDHMGASPLPGGVGVLTMADGRRLFVRAGWDLQPQLLGWTTPDGRFGVAETANVRFRKSLAEAMSQSSDGNDPNDPNAILAKVADYGVIDAYFLIHNLDGTIVTAYMVPKTGRYGERSSPQDQVGKHDDRLSVPELGLQVSGEIGTYDKASADRGIAGLQGEWKTWVFVTLGRVYNRLPPGHYESPLYKTIPMAQWNRLVDSESLFPRDAATFAALQPGMAPCALKVPASEVPPGWIVWTPTCVFPYARIFDPRTGLYIQLEFNGKFAAVRRRLVKRYGLGFSEFSNWSIQWTWEADRFEVDPRTGRIQPEGHTRYSAQWGAPVVGAPGNDPQRASTDYAGYRSAYFEGPASGLMPSGQGLCSRTGEAGGAMEPCEYGNGIRQDRAYSERARMGKAVADREAAEQARAKQERARRDAEAERARQLADEREEAARRERARQDAADDEASRRSILQAFQSVNQSMQSGAAEIAQTNRQSQAYLDEANRIAAQKAENERRRQEDVRRTRQESEDREAYQRARQQQADDFARQQAEARRAAQIEAARQQAQQANMKRQMANPAGGYKSPYETGTQGGAGKVAQGSGKATNADTIDHAHERRCFYLSSNIMAASLRITDCVGGAQDYPSAGALRQAEQACTAKINADIAPLKAEYAQKCDTGKATGQGSQQ